MFQETKTYMPIPQRLGRGDRMGRGPYEKSGIIEDTGLAPGKTKEERFDVLFPVSQEGAEAKPAADELVVEVKLWYLPFGTRNTTPFLWQDVTKTVQLPSSLD